MPPLACIPVYTSSLPTQTPEASLALPPPPEGPQSILHNLTTVLLTQPEPDSGPHLPRMKPRLFSTASGSGLLSSTLPPPCT